MTNPIGRAVVETLEGRQLLSASPLAKPAPPPSVLGDFVGQVIFSSGTTDGLSLKVTSQKGAVLKGTATLDPTGQVGNFTGSVTKKGVVHLNARGAGKFSATIAGKLSGNSLSGTFKGLSGKSHLVGTFSTSRNAVYPPSGPHVLDLNSQALPSGYTLYNATFTATTTSSVISFVFRHDPGWFAFDAASVSTAGGANLLANGGFESGTMAGWNFFAQTGVTHTGFVGNAGSSVGSLAWNPPVFQGNFDWLDGPANGYDGITQTIATTVGVTYNISFELNQHVTQPVTATRFQQISTNGQAGVLGNGIDMLVYAGANAPSTDPSSNLNNTP